MSESQLLTRVARTLDDLEVEYMVTGSIASSMQGEPRATHDIDLVVNLRPADVGALIQVFQPPDFYLSEESMHEAVRVRGMFNLLDVNEGDKVDFWMLTDEAFDHSRFARRQAEEFEGTRVWVSSPEDTILAKLRWAELSGGSEKQFGDALRVFEIQGPNLDRAYLEYWVGQLKLESWWQRLQDEAEIVEP